jgi:tetratricopeptide (TPR) repeat protein
MKSKRRHELQENVLAQEIGKVADFFKVHGNHLATAALIVAILILGYVLLGRRAETKTLHLQQEWARALTGNLKPDEHISALTALAEQTDSQHIAALASVELAYDYARQLLTAKDNSQRSALAEKASQWYQLTIQKFPKEELAVAKAHYGLGKLKEAAGQFQQAGEEYRLARTSPDLGYQPVAQLAEIGLLRLKDLESAKVRMAATMPASRPATPATAPATRPAGPEKTAPATAPATPAKTQPASPAKTPATQATKPAGKAGK